MSVFSGRRAGCESVGEIFQRSFFVPRDFLPALIHSSEEPDPFASPLDPGVHKTLNLFSANAVLSHQGVTFPYGASAVFDHKTSTLTVQNTLANMELVEAFVVGFLTHLPSVLRMRLELYELPNKDALDLVAKTDAARIKESEVGESLFEEIVTMREWGVGFRQEG
jgi:hypothetical protein